MEEPRLAKSALVTTLSVALLFAASTLAAIESPLVARASRVTAPLLSDLSASIVASDELVALPDSDIVPDYIRLYRLSTGGVVLHWTMARRDLLSSHYYRYLVDLRARTFRFDEIPRPDSFAANFFPGERALAERLRAFYDRHDAFHLRVPECSCPYVCSGSWAAQLNTVDPVQEDLTRTTANTWWSRIEDIDESCEWRGGGIGTCWANPDTNLNTEWSVTSCQKTGPVKSDGYIFFAKQGNYINWDWLDDDESTTVVGRVTIEFVEPIVFIDYYHAVAGESAGLLSGITGDSGSNSCHF